MRARPALSALLAGALVGGAPAPAGAMEAGLFIAVVGSTLSGSSCHLSFQVRNRLFADLGRFVAEFTARGAEGEELGQGVFAAGRIRRLQPYLRSASFTVPDGDAASCSAVASVELAIQSCVLEGAGDVGVPYCENGFQPGEGAIEVALAGQLPDGPAAEVLVGELGVTFSSLTRALAAEHGLPGTVQGVVVVGVPQPPAVHGLREGDLVVEVDQERVPTLEELVEQVGAARVRAQESVLCMVVRGGERRWLVARFVADGPAAPAGSAG